jgi:hypothetical protein
VIVAPDASGGSHRVDDQRCETGAVTDDRKTADAVRRAAAEVRERYIFADRGDAAAAAIERALEAGAYDDLDDQRLAARLTDDLRAVCPDRHLKLVHHVDERPPYEGDEWDDPMVVAEYWAEARIANHGVVRVERLDGNVGYLDLRGIDEAEETAPTIAAAMALLQHTYALVLDLRENTGGAPSGVAFLCSYFFHAKPVHLNDVHERAGIQQFWTFPSLPGPRYLDRPVYVLTSNMTFSGAEEIAYNLQQRRRATLIGETTRGGAHPVGQFWVGPHLSIRVPTARSVNPVSGTNWEGVGVVPDLAVPADDALREAHRLALRAVLERIGDSEAPGHADLRLEAEQALAALPEPPQ